MQELQSLSDIFHKKLFRIPDYQRGYAWIEKPHLQDFWEDLINLQDKRDHYTGVLSFKEVNKEIWSQKEQWDEERWAIEGGRSYAPYHVVDGQQRLTTAVILLESIVDLLKTLPDNEGKTKENIYLGGYSLKEITEQYISISQPPDHIIRTYIFGYESDNPSSKFMRHRIFGEEGGGELEETFYTQNLAEAKSFFDRNLKEYYFKYGIKGIEGIFNSLTTRLKFNLYTISDDFDVFVSFETMNNRGKQLSNLEKLKNRLIYLSTLYEKGEVNEDDRQKVRKNINDAWKIVYHQLGREKGFTLPDDDYLRAHWIIYFKYSRKKGDDYIQFLLNEKFTSHSVFKKKAVISNNESFKEISWNDLEEEDDAVEKEPTATNDVVKKAELPLKEINDYVINLGEAAIHWHTTFFPYSSNHITEKEKIWLDRLSRIGMVYFRPLVLSALTNTKISPEKRVELFKAIERFIFLAMRIGRAYSTYGSSAYYNYARELYTNNEVIDEIIAKLNSDLYFIAPNDSGKAVLKRDTFKVFMAKKFDPRNVEGFYAWNGLRHLLFEYEAELSKSRRVSKVTWNSFTTYEKDKVSIEHIYPQTPTLQCWKESFGNYDDYQCQCLSGSLGNLLLLSQSINSKLQNDCYNDKKEVKRDADGNSIRSGYKEGSYSELEVANSWPNWTPESIRERGLTLLNFMERRWEFEFPSEEDKIALLHLEFMK